MDIYDARRQNIPIDEILSYNLTDEEKLVYIFEHKMEEVRQFDTNMYYALLGIANKYK